MHPAPRHRQLRRINRKRRVFGTQRTAFNQCTRRIIGHGGDHFSTGQQRAQTTELWHAEHDAAAAAEFGQVEVDVAAQVAGERDHRVRACAVFVERQRAWAIVAAQDFAGDVAEFFAFGVGRQIGGVTDTDGDLAGRQQRRHQQVVGAAHHDDDARCLFLKLTQQRREQAEFRVVRQADPEHIAAACWLEFLGAADGAGDHVHGRLQLFENIERARRRLHGATVAQQQRIIEQIAQTA